MLTLSNETSEDCKTPQVAKRPMFKHSKHYTLMTESSRPKESKTNDFNFDIRNLLLSPSPKRN